MEEQKSNTFDKDRTSFGTDGSVNEYCIDKSEIQNIVDKNGEESAKPLDFIMDEERETEKESNPKFGLALEKIEQHIEEQAESYKKMAADVREMHKLYHNEFAGRLKSMQDELECYHEIDRGRAFDDVLREVARIYCDNEALLNVEVDDKTAKHIKYLFMDIKQLLESNGVMLQKSKPGDKRNSKFCQIVERIETDNSELHDTVVSSKGTGFYTEKRPFIKELVDVYVYKESAVDNLTE